MLLDEERLHTRDRSVRIRRPRLERRLRDAGAGGITVVIGPAGAGKSELVRVRCDEPGTLYFRAGNERRTFARFVQGLAHAVVSIAPGAQASFPRAWERALQSHTASTVLAHWLAEHLDGCDRHLVVDDLYAAASDANVAAFIGKFAELRSAAGLTIATRSAGMLPVALWMATRRLDRPIDRAELAFTHDEVQAVARGLCVNLSDDHVATMLRATSGSPIAVAYALACLRSEPKTYATAASPDNFDVIAEQILGRRTGRERAYLFTAALFPAIDDDLLGRSGWDDSAQVRAAMDRDAAFMWEAGEDGLLRFHDRFRDELARRFASRDDDFRSLIGHRAVHSLAVVGRHADALEVATQQHLHEAVGDLLDARGFEIVESGAIDVVSEALATLEATDVSLGASALAVRGYIEAQTGKLDTSEAWFRLGLGRAQDERSRVSIALYYARELALRRRADACEVLAEFADSTTLDRSSLIDIRSAYGQALIGAGRLDEAAQRIDEAIGLLAPESPDALRARVFARGAYVAIERAEFSLARERALVAAPLAVAQALYDVAASSYSVLYNVAYERDDDVPASLAYLRNLRDVGVKSGTLRLESYSLLGMYELQAEAGDETALETLDCELLAVDKHDAAFEIMETLLPAKALRATWSGDFVAAGKLLRPTAEQQGTPQRRAMTWARIALFTAAAGDSDQSQAATRSAERELLEPDTPTTQYALTLLHLSLAALVRADVDAARQHFAAADDTAIGAAVRLHALRAAVGALIATCTGTDQDGHALARTLTVLRDTSYGGMAKLIEALPYPGGGKQGCAESVGMRLAARTGSTYVRPAPAIIGLLDDTDCALDNLFESLDEVAPLMAEHSRAVSAWCSRLARILGLAPDEITFVTRCGLIHDIGKMRTPAEILHAPRALSDAEWAIMRAHTTDGGDIVGGIPMLRAFAPIVRGHHERIDGKGYPDGLRGDAIPLAARIVAVADSFNAMIGRRPYRLPMMPTTALDELDRNRGTQFDTDIVDAMVRIVSGRIA